MSVLISFVIIIQEIYKAPTLWLKAPMMLLETGFWLNPLAAATVTIFIIMLLVDSLSHLLPKGRHAWM